MDKSKRRNERRRLQQKVEDDSESSDDMLDDTSEIESQPQFDSSPDMSVDINEEESSASSLFSFEEDVVEPTLQDNLASWATKYQLGRDSLNDLLFILRKSGLDLPKDSRTLLKTPRSVQNVVFNGTNSYCYLGIKSSLIQAVTFINDQIDTLELLVNIDGVPLCKSTNSQFWPILGSVKDTSYVFPIALFYGNTKPTSVREFLSDFINEVENLTHDGVNFENQHFTFVLKAIICDAPARSFLKCTIGHTGYYSCERCCGKGVRLEHRIVFNDFNDADLRTNHDFSRFIFEGTHQKERSPLVDIGFDCVNDFPLDYMHLVLLGVLKRVLTFLLKGPNLCRISRQQSNILSERLVSYNGKMPSNFNRQPRGLQDLCYWKATEYRQFLLYLGPVVLKGVIDAKVYEHFLALHVSMSILLNASAVLDSDLAQYAKDLLSWFVRNAAFVYGKLFNVYNVHALIHLADDVIHHKCSLEVISAFKFENYMQSLKKMVRNSNNPIVQVVKRLAEKKSSETSTQCNKIFKENGKDVFFLSNEGDICEIKNFVDGDKYQCIIFKSSMLEPFYETPIDSRKLGIYYTRGFSHIGKVWKILTHTEVEKKLLMLPYKDGRVYFPLLHDIQGNRF